MATGLLLDSLYYELGLRTTELEAGARRVVASEGEVATAAQKAEDAVTELVEAMLRTPEGAAALEGILKRLTTGFETMTGTMGRVAKQAAGLTIPFDTVIEGMSRAGREAAALAQATATKVPQGFALSGAGANKLRAGFTSLALGATGTNAAVGQLVQGLLLFGAGSGVIAGVAAGVAVIALAYEKLTESAKKTKEAADKASDAVKKSFETPIGTFRAQIADLTDEIDRLQKKSASVVFRDNQGRAITRGQTDPEIATEIARVKARRERLEQLLDDERRKQLDEFAKTLNDLTAARAGLIQAISIRAGLGLPIDDLRSQLADLQKVIAAVEAEPAEQQGRVADTRQAQVAARKAILLQARADLADTFVRTIPQTIDATVDAIGVLGQKLLALEAPAEEVRAKLQPLIDQLLKLRDAAAETRLNEGISQALQAPSLADTLTQLDALAAEQEQIRLTAIEGSAEEATAKARLLTITQAILEANRRIAEVQQDQLGQAEEIVTATQATRRSLVATVQAVGDIARGAIGVAQAFGLANDSTAALLQNVVSIGSELPSVIDQLGKIGKIDPSTGQAFQIDQLALAGGIASVVGGLAGLASGLFGGESPAEKRSREALEHNSEVIADLTRKIGGFGLLGDRPGANIVAVRQGTQTIVDAILQSLPPQLPGSTADFSGARLPTAEVNRVLTALGISMTDLREVAAGLGIEFAHARPTLGELQQVLEAIAAADLTQFQQTFTGQFQAFLDELALWDITDPIEQLERLRELASGEFGSPALQEALAGLDLSDPAQRAEAERRIQDLFERLQLSAAEGGLSLEDLGGLSTTEFLDMLRRFEEMIDAANEAAGTVTGGGPIQESFGVQQTITAATGSQITGLLTSLDIHLVEGNVLLAQILKTLGQPITGIPAPSYPTVTTGTPGASSGITVMIETITITVPGSNVGPAAIQAAVQQGIYDGVDQALGARARARRISVGDSVH